MENLADNILQSWINDSSSEDFLKKCTKIMEKGSRKLKESFVKGDITIDEAYEKVTVHVSNNSGKYEWYTPQKFIDAARKTMGSIDLDPASSEIANKRIQALTYFNQEENGLTKKWFGNVWMNPPYNCSLVTDFTKKLVEELPNINQACVLVNNASETRWFQENIFGYCDVICFVRSRIKFWDVDGNATGSSLQGQVIAYFGKNRDQFYENFQELGICLVLWNKR